MRNHRAIRFDQFAYLCRKRAYCTDGDSVCRASTCKYWKALNPDKKVVKKWNVIKNVSGKTVIVIV